ncbi:MAG: DNA ligase D [Gemmatimonadota bacterium]
MRERDFANTPEPSRDGLSDGGGSGLRFVIQKHDASHLHYDLRLEMQGVMRSWAVPKGPSLDPSVKRLAMEVEDHPISYNDFEGTIPEGEYGGGTVMLWDRGTYLPDETKPGEKPEKAVLRGYRAGKLSLTFHGERLQGSFALVRTDTVKGGVRSEWLMMKQSDDTAEPGVDITEEVTTSVASGRTMEQIASGKGGERVWKSNRPQGKARPKASRSGAKLDYSAFKPMLATTGKDVPRDPARWTYEPKYDGIRVLAFATPGSVALVTRNGHDKARQFPEVVRGLEELVEDLGTPVVLDGEIVPRVDGRIGRFEALQGRMHVQDRSRIPSLAAETPTALAAFDILLRGEEALVGEGWESRRSALEETLEGRVSDTIVLAPTTGDHRALIREAEKEGWEGIIAKRIDGRYRPGQRSSDWLKLKLENQQELVVGGWTEPRKSRSFIGAILLGYYDEAGDFIYAGHTGTGFKHEQLAEMHRILRRLERKTPPFKERPKTNEPAHWTTPRVVVEVKFNEWTRDGKLRQPVFLGIREDKDAKEVVREPDAVGEEVLKAAEKQVKSTPPKRRASAKAGRRTPEPESRAAVPDEELDTAVASRIRELRAGSGEGDLEIDRSTSLPVTSLDKVFYPTTGHTKGDLLVYYSRMADLILPWMKGRPLVLKRFPNGVDEESFYQQAAPDSVPNGVRVETLQIERKQQRRLVGGNLATLLYTVQLGAISFDPWHSRVRSLDFADYTILDLDPGPGADFQRVVEVARWTKEEMDALGLHGALKTSGSSGLHIYLPLPKKTPLDAATLIAQIVATRVAQKHPKEATVERMTKKRPRGTIYVDYLQNILGKTVAGVYAARAKPRPTVSTPLAWDELTDDLDLQDFTVDTVPQRVREVGDVWSAAMAKPNDLSGIAGA